MACKETPRYENRANMKALHVEKPRLSRKPLQWKRKIKT